MRKLFTLALAVMRADLFMDGVLEFWNSGVLEVWKSN